MARICAALCLISSFPIIFFCAPPLLRLQFLGFLLCACVRSAFALLSADTGSTLSPTLECQTESSECPFAYTCECACACACPCVCVCVRLEVCYGQKNLGHHLGAYCLSWDNTHATVSDSVALFTFFCICSREGAGRGKEAGRGLDRRKPFPFLAKITNSQIQIPNLALNLNPPYTVLTVKLPALLLLWSRRRHFVAVIDLGAFVSGERPNRRRRRRCRRHL